MKSLIRSRITLVWFLLVAATALSWEMGHGFGFDDIRYASIAIIAVAFVKVRFVILEFMEIRCAPLLMRVISEVWCVLVCAVLMLFYLKDGTVT